VEIFSSHIDSIENQKINEEPMPRAGDVPPFAFSTHNVPSRANPLGVKGGGEAGAVGAPPAVINAIVDALHRRVELRHIDMPATPRRVWETLNGIH
jgi:carbon-monoxide dehydrogenase large subunit